MKSFFSGRTSTGLPIPGYQFGNDGPHILILGGVHGDEPEGVEAAYGLIGKWGVSFPYRLRVAVIPAFNLDGVLHGTRGNARGVDLNRNMATNDWSAVVTNPRYNPGPSANSEPETVHLVNYLNEFAPAFILSLHSWHPVLNMNGDCRNEAQAIASWTGYRIDQSIGYPTPGCLGTYCGIERDMPTLTYEIERGQKTSEILRMHIPAIEEALKVSENTRQKTL